MKRILAFVLAALLAVTLISCTSKNGENNKTDVAVVYENVDLAAVADSLYDGIAEDNRPFVMSMPAEDAEMFQYFTFIPYEEGLEAVANEPMMSSIAHSIVLVKCPTIEKANEVAAAMKENCDPRKWMCVEADIVEAVTNGNIAMLLMTTTEGGMSETILNNFKALDAEKIASLKSEIFDGILDDEAVIEDEFYYVDDESAEDVVVELPEADAGEEPAAAPEEDADMPALDTPAVEAPAVEEPKEEAPAEEVSIDTLYEIADKLYEGFDRENMPMVGTMELTEENFEYSAFVPYKSSYLAVESMPMMGSMPHSVVIVRADSEKEAAELAENMKKNADPRKWICVSARSVKSAHKGNYAILAMIGMQVMPDEDISEEVAEKMSDEQSEERVDAIIANFLKAVK